MKLRANHHAMTLALVTLSCRLSACLTAAHDMLNKQG